MKYSKAEKHPEDWKFKDLRAWYMKMDPDFRKKFKKKKEKDNESM